MKDFRVTSKAFTVGWKVCLHFVRVKEIQKSIQLCVGWGVQCSLCKSWTGGYRNYKLKFAGSPVTDPNLWSSCSFKCTEEGLLWKASSVPAQVCAENQCHRAVGSSETLYSPPHCTTPSHHCLFFQAFPNIEYTRSSMNLRYLLFASSLEHEVSEGRNFHCSCLCFSGAQNSAWHIDILDNY